MSGDKCPVRYLFLMRHAQHSRGRLTADGEDHVRAVANRLTEWVHAEWRDAPGRSIHVWRTTDGREVRSSADLLRRQAIMELARLDGAPSGARRLCRPPTGRSSNGSARVLPHGQSAVAPAVPCAATSNVNPSVALTAYRPDSRAFDSLLGWLQSSETGHGHARSHERDAPLLIGNDPLIGWLATKLTRRPTPVARGELICLVRERTGRRFTAARWRLLWTLSDDGRPEVDAIQAKIKSKMTTAGALGTFILGLTAFLLQNLVGRQPSSLQWLALASLAASSALYFVSLFLYDSLQMPARFWASGFRRPLTRSAFDRAGVRLRYGKASLRRPPTSTARVLQVSMVQVWTFIFTPATWLGGAGVACLALDVARGEVVDQPRVGVWQVLVATVVIAIGVTVWSAWQRPDLGASD